MAKNAHSFNSDHHVKELNDRFGRLIKNMGINNKKGTDRYDYEVDFSYALHDIKMGPAYMQGKMFDRAAGIVNSLIADIKDAGQEAN
jgi:hypothetical protein